ncbi:hypothetical protein [Pantoea sp. 18069]|uniref:hypothetical protein n=1 Tax=Pantoea sp. 18069 TaxID=2681415 RepID=UPI0013572452|nr:hypothetical protein [Pantoea sp. 18069]
MATPSNAASRAIAQRALPSLATSLALSLAFILPVHAQEKSVEKRDAATSRAEVVADLALWRRAGLDRSEPLHSSYSLQSSEYGAAHQEYLRLRASDEFQREVQKALAQR